MDTRKVCRGLWMFIFNAIEESDSNQTTELIQEKVRDVAVVVFRNALKENTYPLRHACELSRLARTLEIAGL